MRKPSVCAVALVIGGSFASCVQPPDNDGGSNDDVAAESTNAAAAAPYDWLQFNGSAQHSGNNTLESQLAASNVSKLTRLFQATLPTFADGAPVVLGNVSAGGATRDLAFVTTRAGDIVALDAHSGAIVWQKAHGAGSCKVNNGSSACYTTSSPAIDPGRAYVYSYGLDGYVHKHAVADGAEVTSGGWPELASLKPFNEKSASALAFATAKSGRTYLYVSAGGYPGDNGDYQGHITVIDLGSGSQRVFNTLCSSENDHFQQTPGTPDCSDVQSAVWARAGAIYDASLDRLFIATGNGNYAPGRGAWADSIIALNPDGTGNAGPIDAYTPATFQQLQDQDNDLGSTAPLILPAIANSKVAHVALQSGKDSLIRLVDLSNLSGKGGPGHTGGELAQVNVPQGGRVLTAPATWTDGSGTVWAFVADGSGLSALTVTADSTGKLSLTTKWQHSGSRTSPLVANGVLYVAGSNVVEALDPTSGSTLWSDTTIGSLHWQSVVVANGTLFIEDSSAHLTAYALPATGGTLPAPWVDGDVGAVGHPGSASATNGSFTVNGSGADIWGTADAAHFVRQPLSGNGTIVARVASVTNTNAWAKAGVTVRESTAAGARHAIMVITPGNGASFQRRKTANGTSTSTTTAGIKAPYWVRLQRNGSTITGSISPDGQTWTTVGSDTVAVPTSAQIGLIVTAHDNTKTATAVFDHVTVTTP